MVQFNLLPDVKLEYVKTQRTKRLVIFGALGVTGICVFILVLLFMLVNVFQRQHIGNLNDDIKQYTADLEKVPELDEVLTIQNQLNVLNGLHEQKPAAQRIYDYLVQLTPSDAKLSEVSINYEENTISLSGSATSLQVINKFVDTVKFTEYQYDDAKDRAFSNVVLSSYGISESDSAQERTSYTIDLIYDPVIFDNTKAVTLVVPPIISTRSITEKPQDLFEPKPIENPIDGNGGTQ
ncbi:hypothetical protein KC950_00970 [Candidatus Saccharibacteria bacterium]|nr:hypothetical protein [Candidatus Saccharibacteria bacterium]